MGALWLLIKYLALLSIIKLVEKLSPWNIKFVEN